jgi:glycosyltransferase involved in cell wall biosynthesis
MSDPRVSVVMGVYNDAEYVTESIESILYQTYKQFEFVIIDDGSTDRSSELLQNYADQDDRVVLFCQSNSGLTRALNAGLARANGKYIARMDADDVANPTRLERQVEFLEENQETVLVGTQYTEIDADGNAFGRSDFPTTDQEIRDVLMKYNPFFHASVMMRADAISSAGGTIHRSNTPRTTTSGFVWLRWES